MSTSKAVGLPARVAPDVFVAADVGGTHVRIALVRERLDASGIEVLAVEKYRCNEYSGLDAIFAAFLAQAPGGAAVRRGVIASAGYALEDGSVIAANLPWPLVPRQIQQRLGLGTLALVNDFEAVAHAARQMGEHEVLHLAGPGAVAAGPVFVLGPGTGLGAALFVPHAQGALVLPTEAGHAALAPGNALELQVLAEMRRSRSHVAVEHLLSGPGLLNFYNALCVLQATSPVHDAPDQVTRAALAGGDALALSALQGFCGLLGSVVGDAALQYGARTVYLAGGFLPQIAGFLAGSTFVARMHDKGAMRPALEQVTVKVVEHGLLGVLGAAQWLVRSGRT